VIVAELQGGPTATILDFVFPGMPEATIAGTTIRVQVPLSTDLTQLSPTYNTGSPLVTGKPASGSTNDFTKPQTYTITAPDGSTRAYIVTVIPTLGAVGVANHSFEKFDFLNEYDETVGKNPPGATWSFANKAEAGINLLTGPISAPPAPDGSRHTAHLRGAGSSMWQSIQLDGGKYTVSFDAVKRRGYTPTGVPLTVTMDGAPVMTVETSRLTEAWGSYTSAVFTATSGAHTLAFTIGQGEGMDLVDNVAIHRVQENH